MKATYLFLLTLCICPFTTRSNSIDSTWLKANYLKSEYRIEMRDGVKLYTAVYIPTVASRPHPFLMVRTPYSCAPYGTNNFHMFFEYWESYLKAGYIFVFQDVRGKFMSEGTFEELRPFRRIKENGETDEATDAFDTIEWLLKNIPNNNGKVGSIGTSYEGFYAAMSALCGHQALVASSIQGPCVDWFKGDDFHHHGALFQMDAFSYFSTSGRTRKNLTTANKFEFDYPTLDSYKFFLEPRSTAEIIGLIPDTTFWNEMQKHLTYDSWWKNHNVANYADVLPKHIATLIVGGLFDAENLYGAVNLYKSIEVNSRNDNRLVLGPWYHGQWSIGDGTSVGYVRFDSNTSITYQQEMEIPFFKYHLENEVSSILPKEANIFFSGENTWRTFESWPPQNVKPKQIYLNEKNGLSFTAPTSKRDYTEYTSNPNKPVPYAKDIHSKRTVFYMTDDQRFADRRTDVISFQTEILNDDITLAGPLIAELFVSVSSTDADFIVKLIDVFPSDFTYTSSGGTTFRGDYQMMVRGDVMPGKFRIDYDKPVPFKPNKVELVKVELNDVAHTFKRGHRIMIQIQSSWFPLVKRNTQDFHSDDSYEIAKIKVFHDRSRSSYISLPILK